MKKEHDFMACPGNVCETHPENTETTWFPDEPLCIYRPRPKWLIKMYKIQKLYLKGIITADRYFTKRMVEKLKAIRRPKGKDPQDAILAPEVALPVRKQRPNTPRSTSTSSILKLGTKS